MLFVNGEPINVTIFPDKTSQVWKLPEHILKSKEGNAIEVTWEFNNEGEFLQLAQLKELLDEYNQPVNLTIPYLPYGRQDKNVSNETTFALIPFSKLLNSLDFKSIWILDAHSQVALYSIHKSIMIYPIPQIYKATEITKADLICYPDKGAREKYTNVYKEFGLPTIYGEKVRDQSTGNILSYKLIGECKDKRVLIIDDICDGGMTFKILTKDLLEAGAKEVNLFVTHGIFSKGLQTLKDSGIKHIYTRRGEATEAVKGEIVYWELS